MGVNWEERQGGSELGGEAGWEERVRSGRVGVNWEERQGGRRE